MPLNSAIYEGWVRHRRFAPTPHAFRYALALTYLDLDELPTLFRGRLMWGYERPALIAFHRADYLGDPRQPLQDAVRDLVSSRLGRRPEGAIRLLTQLRHFGYAFNPVRVYYCFDADALDAIVLEVRNTPWGERHCYVLDARPAVGGLLRCEQPKAFHVSPFLNMDLAYRFAMTAPAERLTMHMDCVAPTGKLLDATMFLTRQPWNRSTTTRLLIRYPWTTGRVVAAIYWQAMRLWLKRVPYVSRPHESSIDDVPPTPRKPRNHQPLSATASELARELGPQPASPPARNRS